MESTGVDYPMLCDPEGIVLSAYGVRGLLGFAKRVSFLIDAEGRIAKTYRSVSPSGHAAEVLSDLRSRIGGQPG